MLARRIIPCLDVRDGRVVKGTKFKDIVDVDDPKTLGKKYSESGADELVFYDITASAEKRSISMNFVSEVAQEINIPFCVGGGIKTIEDISEVLRKGADKISINSSAIDTPLLIQEGAKKFGSQCIVLSMDVMLEIGSYNVYKNGGRVKTDLTVVEWAIKAVSLGAGEIVVNSMNHDGTKNGFDIELLQQITKAVNVPVIASGGAGTVEHFIEVATKTDVDGYLAASVFHYNEIPIKTLKEILAKNNIPIRLSR